MNRIITTGTNSTIPKDAAQQAAGTVWGWTRCRNCGGDGYTYEFYTNDPSERAHRETCPECKGEGLLKV